MTPRTRKTSAYKVFEKNIGRSRAFLRIFGNEPNGGRKQGQPSLDEKELLRGSLVFAVGALDAYLRDLVLEVVPVRAQIPDRLNGALREIAKNDPGLSLRIVLCNSNGGDAADEFRAALSTWLDGKSFQGPAAIANALGYVGCNIPWSDFDAATGQDTPAILDQVTQQRHKIVHRGQKPNVLRDTIKDRVDFVEAVAKLIDREVCKTLR